MTFNYPALARSAYSGENEPLFTACYSALNRDPRSVDECEEVIRQMPAAELEMYVEESA